MYIKPYYLSTFQRINELRQRFELQIPEAFLYRFVFRLVLNGPADRDFIRSVKKEVRDLSFSAAGEYFFIPEVMDELVAVIPNLSDDWQRFKANKKPVWKLGARSLDFSQGPFIMGILNVTPDSFSDGGFFVSRSKAVEHALQMKKNGADIIDIGGESSRPGANPVSLSEELERTIPVIQEIRKRSDVLISIDTYKSKVAEEALHAGADIVNDISAATFDEKMVPLVRQVQCPLIAMHMKGNPRNMQKNPEYTDAVDEIYDYFINRIKVFRQNNLSLLAIDPGIGFGKKLGHNLHILRDLRDFRYFGQPILIGLSRKSMIGQVLDRDVRERLSGSLAANLLAWQNGSDIIRVHDVRDTKDALLMAKTIVQS